MRLRPIIATVALLALLAAVSATALAQAWPALHGSPGALAPGPCPANTAYGSLSYGSAASYLGCPGCPGCPDNPVPRDPGEPGCYNLGGGGFGCPGCPGCPDGGVTPGDPGGPGCLLARGW